MTEEKLKRCNQLSRLLNQEIAILSDIKRFEKGKIGEALNSLLIQDKEFKTLFEYAVSSTKVRIEKEFNEL